MTWNHSVCSAALSQIKLSVCGEKWASDGGDSDGGRDDEEMMKCERKRSQKKNQKKHWGLLTPDPEKQIHENRSEFNVCSSFFWRSAALLWTLCYTLTKRCQNQSQELN